MIRFAFLADDFTGAIDALWQFQRFGLRTELIVDSDDLERVSPDTDVVGIATTLRSMRAEEIEAQVAPMLDALVRTGAAVVQYKVCSTFDSSPDVGSIGRVISVARHSGAFRGLVPVMPAQPELGRFTVYSHHFARHDGEVYRIDRHPIMSVHPVTPSHEADLRVELRRQAAGPVDAAHTAQLSEAGLRDRLRAADDRDEALVMDASTADDSSRIGRALLDLIAQTGSPTRPLFAVGSGGLSWALAHGLTSTPPAGVAPAGPTTGPVLALSGSRSSVTAGQIDVAEQNGWLVLDLLGDEQSAIRAARDALASGVNVVLYGSRGAVEHEEFAPDVGARLARAATACLDVEALSRLIVMGGDTSGEVLKALGIQAMQLRTMMPPMVPLCTVTSPDPRVARLEVALKGGQLGDPDYLVRLGRR